MGGDSDANLHRSPSNKIMNEEIIKKIESQEKTIEMLCKRIDIAHERIDAIREMVENLKNENK